MLMNWINANHMRNDLDISIVKMRFVSNNNFCLFISLFVDKNLIYNHHSYDTY